MYVGRSSHLSSKAESSQLTGNPYLTIQYVCMYVLAEEHYCSEKEFNQETNF